MRFLRGMVRGEPSHNPYFNRWFSAINSSRDLQKLKERHNPYFNRWFSAILKFLGGRKMFNMSQSLF